MSNTEADREIESCGGSAAAPEPVFELLEPRAVLIGPRQEVRRVLPNKERRMIGAWCFVDHYGPEDISGRTGMRVPPHPHSGLQTVSWLFDGEIQHRDSLGSDAVIVPGQLNVMTSGPGIAHSEESAPGHSPHPARRPVVGGAARVGPAPRAARVHPAPRPAVARARRPPRTRHRGQLRGHHEPGARVHAVGRCRAGRDRRSVPAASIPHRSTACWPSMTAWSSKGRG